MNKYLKHLNRLEFVVTMACTGKCKHCSQGKHKDSGNLDGYIAADTVRAVAEEYNINSVMTFGGEPLLYPDAVCKIHEAAKEMGISERQLITNGFFSKDSYMIKSVAEKLAESGVNEILLSVDAFHQETIPLEQVIIFAKSVLEIGIPIKVHPAWLVSADAQNSYNNITRELLTIFNATGIETSGGNVIFPAGNAVEYLSDYFDISQKIKNPYDEDPSDVKAICVSADGSLLGGNIYTRNIRDILSSYIPE